MEYNNFQQPYQVPQQPQKPVGLGVASMVLGIISLLLSCCIPYLPLILAILGLVLGIAGVGKNQGGKGMAIAGIVCSSISLIPAIFLAFVGASLFSELSNELARSGMMYVAACIK